MNVCVVSTDEWFDGIRCSQDSLESSGPCAGSIFYIIFVSSNLDRSLTFGLSKHVLNTTDVHLLRCKFIEIGDLSQVSRQPRSLFCADLINITKRIGSHYPFGIIEWKRTNVFVRGSAQTQSIMNSIL